MAECTQKLREPNKTADGVALTYLRRVRARAPCLGLDRPADHTAKVTERPCACARACVCVRALGGGGHYPAVVRYCACVRVHARSCVQLCVRVHSLWLPCVRVVCKRAGGRVGGWACEQGGVGQP